MGNNRKEVDFYLASLPDLLAYRFQLGKFIISGRLGDYGNRLTIFLAGDRKGSYAAAANFGTASFYSGFDVIGVIISSPDDDHVLQAAANKQFAVMHEANVAGAHITFGAIAIGEPSEKHLLR